MRNGRFRAKLGTRNQTIGSILKPLWDITFGPAYERLFRRFFEATLSRLNTIGDDVSGLRTQLRSYGHELHGYGHGTNLRLDALNERVAELEAQVSQFKADKWDEVAVARRVAALEDLAEPVRAGSDTAESAGAHES